ncbi:MAG: tape measure protein [Bacteroidetes bacterium]|nr:tape measure protein [Bacteroidota bacterium]
MSDDKTVKIIFVGEDRGAGSMLAGLKGGLAGIATVAGGIIASKIFTEIASQIKTFATDGFNAVMAAEKLQINLESLVAIEMKLSGVTNNMADAYELAKGKAAELSGWLRTLSLTSPFDTATVKAAFNQAMAYGLSAEMSQTLTESTLNWGASLGKTSNDVQDFIWVLSQMNSTGEVTQKDLYQLANRGLNLQLIAEKLGTTVDGLKDVAPIELINAFNQLSDEVYGEGIERNINSLSALTSFFTDFKDFALQDIFTPVFEVLKPFLKDMQENMLSPEYSEKLKNFGLALADVATNAMTFVGEVSGVLTNLTDIGTLLLSGEYDESVAKLRQFFDFDTSQDIVNFVRDIKDSFTNLFSGTPEGGAIFLMEMFGVENTNKIFETITSIKNFFNENLPAIQEVFTRTMEPIKVAWDELIENLNSQEFYAFKGLVLELPSLMEIVVGAITGVLVLASLIITTFLLAFDDFVTLTQNVLARLGSVIQFAMIFIEGIAKFLVGVFTLNGEKIAHGLAEMSLGFFGFLSELVIGTLETIVDIAKYVLKIIAGIIDTFVALFTGNLSNEASALVDAFFNTFQDGIPDELMNNGINVTYTPINGSGMNGNNYAPGQNWLTPGTNSSQNPYNSSLINNNSDRSLVINIGNFSGTEENIVKLSRSVKQTLVDNGY